jgi:hypothetical protein
MLFGVFYELVSAVTTKKARRVVAPERAKSSVVVLVLHIDIPNIQARKLVRIEGRESAEGVKDKPGLISKLGHVTVECRWHEDDIQSVFLIGIRTKRIAPAAPSAGGLVRIGPPSPTT